MKILMFSADPTILDADSATTKRMVEYGRRVEKLDILILTPHLATGYPSEVWLAENTRVRAFDGKFSRFLKAFFVAWQMVKKEKYDLLVAQDIEHAFMCWLLGGKWQMQIHTDIFSPYFWQHSMLNKVRVVFAKFLIPRAYCIRVVSRRIKDSIMKKFKNLENKVVVLPILPVLADLNVEPKRFTEFDKTILMVSRLASEKNIGLVIDAMAEIIKKHPKTGLIIIGDGPERRVLELRAVNHRLKTNVKFEGWQSDVVSYLKGADIFLMTSWYEGWGMSVIDAARYGAAVVMTDVGLAGEVIEDEKTGLVVPVGDKNALIVSILRLLENDDFRRDLVGRAAKKVQELPYAEMYYQKMVESWQKCLNS